ncbi:MAG: 3-oxoacyl-[acyl-carrier-protein] reductase [Desulfobacterota bacterium]|jgi:3-oxoacyl-[acyl-carrier protein] reductase|nr:3-oxoacyl-[acyl-carrier-protein] reductase [Thermodesulfobacteriota bacterium]
MSGSERVVVITGGSRGIGRAIAFRFADEKPKLVLLHYDPDDSAAQESLERLADRGVAGEAHRIDVSNRGEVDRLFKDLIARFGRVNVLINNAGITKDGLLMRMSEDEWDLVLRVNLKGVFNCSQAVIRSMIKERSGRIVNISSVAGQMGNAGQTNYAASKAGMMGFTKSLAREVGSRGITVNAVAPGYINTEMTSSLPEKLKEAFVQQIPLARVGEPEDVAEAVYWLCSEGARYVTGQVIHVNGGLYM